MGWITGSFGRIRTVSFVLFAVFALAGCRLTVSLTGGNVDPRAKTVYIQTFRNNATLVNPTLSNEFTSALKDRIQGQTPLTIIDTQNGDYKLEGEISGYSINPVAIQGDETAAMNRLTITVNVRFTNNADHTQDFEKSFSASQSYETTQSLQSVQEELVTQMVKDLCDQIFNATVANW